MADGTHIEWCDATWQPVTGCSIVSPGCTNCYAMHLAGTRLRGHSSRAGLTRASNAGPVWTGEVRFNSDWLDQPLHWRQPRRIFVCAHGDLFHASVPDEWIDRVFAVMALAPRHQFLVLTKRSNRMRNYLEQCGAILGRQSELRKAIVAIAGGRDKPGVTEAWIRISGAKGSYHPLPNVSLGVSVEDQTRADERIPELLATPAATRFISAEPLLGPVDLLRTPRPGNYHDWLTGECESAMGKRTTPHLDWVIVGGESGPGARPMHPDWARSLRDQCAGARVPFFFKQWGEWIDADSWLDGLSYTPTVSGEPWRAQRPLSYSDAAWLAEATGRAGLYQHQSDGSTIIRVGKKAAGRLLDGREHSEFPA